MLKKYKILAAVAAMSFGVIAATPASAIVVNGGFEADVGLGTPDWDVYSDGIPGWSVSGGAGIEVQRGNIGGALPYEGEQKVELDSHGQNSNSSMFQTLTLGAGTYEFSFAYLGRTGDEGTNGIEYSLAPGIIGITEVTGVVTDGWKIFTEIFSLASEQDVTITFAAIGAEDTYGGYIDNVQVSAVPLPPAVLLFGAALGGLGWLGRRRRKSA